jgi:hypothetical protein
MKPVAIWGAAAVLALALAGCQGKSSAVSGGASGAGGGAVAASAGGGAYGGGAYGGGGASGGGYARSPDPRDLPVPQMDGKPLWAANRTHTAEENAQYQFTKNGADFGAHSETEYVTRVRHFIDKPPRDVETLDRPNGDKLMYDPGGNVFVVVARNGAPRTMFKPKGGAAYWAQQKDREARSATAAQGGGSDQG